MSDPGGDVGFLIATSVAGGLDQLTSLNLQQLRELIEEARNEKAKLEHHLRSVESQLAWAKLRRAIVLFCLLPVFVLLALTPPAARKLYRRTRRTVDEIESSLNRLNDKLRATTIGIDFDVSPEVTEAFDRIMVSFAALRECRAKWNIVKVSQADQFHWRTTASETIERLPVTFRTGDAPYIRTAKHALVFENVTGTTIYVYPGFVMVTGRAGDFALIDPSDLTVRGGGCLLRCPRLIHI